MSKYNPTKTFVGNKKENSNKIRQDSLLFFCMHFQTAIVKL